jgi:hypothetical protein
LERGNTPQQSNFLNNLWQSQSVFWDGGDDGDYQEIGGFPELTAIQGIGRKEGRSERNTIAVGREIPSRYWARAVGS